MAGKVWKGENVLLKYEYDFADLGGAQGTFALGNLPDNFVVSEMFVVIETALAGGSTVILGEDGGGDADGYSGASLSEGKQGGALISDGYHKVAAAQDGLLMTVSVADLTAGKFQVYVRGLQS